MPVCHPFRFNLSSALRFLASNCDLRRCDLVGGAIARDRSTSHDKHFAIILHYPQTPGIALGCTGSLADPALAEIGADKDVRARAGVDDYGAVTPPRRCPDVVRGRGGDVAVRGAEYDTGMGAKGERVGADLVVHRESALGRSASRDGETSSPLFAVHSTSAVLVRGCTPGDG
jgi:hypothetical protein